MLADRPEVNGRVGGELDGWEASVEVECRIQWDVMTSSHVCSSLVIAAFDPSLRVSVLQLPSSSSTLRSLRVCDAFPQE